MGHYFRQQLLSFHPICLMAHNNVQLCTVPGCLDAGRPVQLAVLWVTRQRAVGWYWLRLSSCRPFSLLSKKDVNFQNTKFYFFQGEYIIMIIRVIIIYCIAKQTLLQCISSVILTLFFFFQVKTTAESIEEPGNPIYFQFY